MAIHIPRELRASDFYKTKMSSARGSHRLLTPEHATREDPEIWTILNWDPVSRHAMDHSREIVIGKEWRFEPFDNNKKNRDIAEVYNKLFRKTKNLKRFLFAISEFFIRGESYGYPNFCSKEIDVLDDGRKISWFFPEEVKHIDRYRITKIPLEGGGIGYKVYDDITKTDIDLDAKQVQSMLYFNNSSEEGRFSYGNPLLDAIYWAWYCRKNIEVEFLNLSERFGQGMLVAKIEDVKLGSDELTLQAYKKKVLQILKFAKSRHAIALGKNDTLEILDPSGTGVEILTRAIDYYDGLILRLLVGANLSVESQQTGSYAQASVHRQTTFDKAAYNREIIEEGINNSLVMNLWRLNRFAFSQLGLADGEPPRFKLSATKDEEPETNLAILEGAQRLGMPIKKEQAYKMLKLEIPREEEGDEVLTPPLISLAHPLNPHVPVEEQPVVLGQGSRYLDKNEKFLDDPEQQENSESKNPAQAQDSPKGEPELVNS